MQLDNLLVKKVHFYCYLKNRTLIYTCGFYIKQEYKQYHGILGHVLLSDTHECEACLLFCLSSLCE